MAQRLRQSDGLYKHDRQNLADLYDELDEDQQDEIRRHMGSEFMKSLRR
jgi:hypothetical protein